MNLVKDTAVKIAENLPYESIRNLSLANKKFYGWIWENFDFWKAKLLKDFGFPYANKKDKKSITFYYTTLYYAVNGRRNCNIQKMLRYPDLLELLQKILQGKCQYTYLRGKEVGQKCGKLGKLYWTQYFCPTCIKRAQVQRQIQENKETFITLKNQFQRELCL